MDVISLALARKALDPKANVYEFKGSCAFEDLPEEAFPGEVWNITDDFDLDGKHYEAGTNVAYTNDGWDALTASIDTSIFELNANKVTSLSDQSTNEQYPSAKAVFDSISSEKINLIPYPTMGTAHGSYIKFLETKKGIYIFNYYNDLSRNYFIYQLKSTGSSIVNSEVGNPVMVIITVDDTSKTKSGDTLGFLISIDAITGAYQQYAIKRTNNSTVTFSYVQELNGSKLGFRTKMITPVAQSFDGVKTFTDLPVSTPVPTQDGQLTNKKYVDDAIANIDISTATSAQIQALFGTEGGE